MCPWNGNIPQPTDQLNNSQPALLQNFQAIEQLVSVNHFDFNTANVGKHTQVTLPENLAPTPTVIDTANIYSQLSPLTMHTELYWQRENNPPDPTAAQIIQWTGGLSANNGWTYLPSGMLVKWGSATTNAVPYTVIFPMAGNIPGFATAVFIAAGANYATNSGITVSTIPGTLTPLQFQVRTIDVNNTDVDSSFWWIAIGT